MDHSQIIIICIYVGVSTYCVVWINTEISTKNENWSSMEMEVVDVSQRFLMTSIERYKRNLNFNMIEEHTA